jgi:hypothetical protein
MMDRARSAVVHTFRRTQAGKYRAVHTTFKRKRYLWLYIRPLAKKFH